MDGGDSVIGGMMFGVKDSSVQLEELEVISDQYIWCPVVNAYLCLAWRQTPETGSGDVAFTNWAAQVKMQKYIFWYTFCHLQ